jgi:Oxidoreductase family, NAD-binding Rossmann fold
MPTINPITRRDFLISAGLTGAAFAINHRSLVNTVGANERARVGIIGVGSRGVRHISAYSALPNVEVAALCDINESALKTAAAGLVSSGRPQPASFTDFRRLLECRDLDVISIAVPRASRARLAIAACDAGRNVLIEQPCCDGLAEGRTLERVATAKGRLVQQVANDSFVSTPELLMFLKTRDAGDIVRVSALQQVFLQAGDTITSGKDVDDTLENLDVARCLMGVRFPTHVSSIGSNRSKLSAIFKSSFLFANENRVTRAIELTRLTSAFNARVLANPDASIDGVNNGASVSSLTFHTSEGEFAVSSRPLRGLEGEPPSSWVNFVSAVRDHDVNALHNPIGEARVSSSLLKLAEASMRFERGFTFDPERECAVDDPEIDAFIQ